MQKVISTGEYARLRNITPQKVREAAIKGWKMPGVLEILPRTGTTGTGWLFRVELSEIPHTDKKHHGRNH